MTLETIKQTIRELSFEQALDLRAFTDADMREREQKRRDDAMAEIKRIAALHDVSVSFPGAKRARKAKAPAYKGGHCYQHPTDKALVWTAKGQKPNWLRELEAQGGKPLELPPLAANDNAPVPVKKAG